MTKELSVQDAFMFIKGDKLYAVVLCGLKNDANGNRRYEATVVDLTDLGARGKGGAFRYRFTWHCGTPAEEAEWALSELHLKKAR